MTYFLRTLIVLAVVASFTVTLSSAQETDTASTTIAADPADVESVDSIITALYDVISGPVGQERNWNRFRSLFLPSANLVPVFHDQQGSVQIIEMTPEEYIARSGAQLAQIGFTESEISRVEERFGNLVHVLSTYEGYGAENPETPLVRGINSIQILFKDGRWWVANIAWQPEQPAEGIVLSRRYLPSDEP